MIVVISGGRDRDLTPIELEMLWCLIANRDDECTNLGYVTLRAGDCPTGVDESIRKDFGNAYSYTRFEADWDKHGKAAGPIRNREMLTKNVDDNIVLFAFPSRTGPSRGTRNCMKQAHDMGIQVVEFS